MNLPIYELEISEDLNDDIEVNVVSLVKRPAIKKNFLAFEDDSFDNYPEAVKENARRALKWADENGWKSCGTEVGKARANQLAKGEKISFETIQRMYSYLSRHKVDLENSKSYDDGCGKLMYDAWGGDEALAWSERIVNKNQMKFEIKSAEKRIISGPIMLADTPIYRKDKTGEYYVTFTKETISKIVQVFFKKGYQSSVNLMHDGQNFVEGVTMFESWITDKERGIEPMKGFEDAPEGSWFGSFKVDNDQVWERVKVGDFEGFSVEGAFLMVGKKKESQMSDKEIFEKVMDILSKVK